MDLLYAVILSALPISELRGGIPYALYRMDNPVMVYFLCVGANLLAFPITFFFLQFLHRHFEKIALYKKFFDKFVYRTRKKTEHLVEKWGFWGLMIFVMIPLPVTGAYTGTFAAWLFKIPKRQAFLAVTLGVMIAGLIVTAVCLTGASAFQIFIKPIEPITPI